MRFLVTGAHGFIGRHLCRELVEHGHDVVDVDKRDGDLRQPGVIDHLLETYEPEVCVHLAAKVGRLFGEDDLAETIIDNAAMTALVAKACGDRGIRLAYASTSEVYGDGDELVCREEDQISYHDRYASITVGERLPHNLYGVSKRWGEEACRLYALPGTALTILRFSMPYGPGLPAGRGRAALINFLDCARKREPITVHAGAERSWCWIGDTVRGTRMILESGRGGAWNVGRDDNRTPMKTVAMMACDLVGAPYELIVEVDPPARQTVVKRLANDKLCSLGWQPQVELPEGMVRTLAEMPRS